MRVVSYNRKDDIGGAGYRMASAFNRLRPDWSYQAFRGQPSYLQFPEHTPWHKLSEAWEQADVVHTHDDIRQVGSRKPTVVTYHGVGYRGRSHEFMPMLLKAGITVGVSTLDLWLEHPNDTHWIPGFEDLDWLASFRKPQDGPLRIGHAPTHRARKATTEFLAACERLGREIPIEVVLIENTPWLDCLPIKGTVDILFDQTAYGYGGNAIEAWGMGIPVICGAPDATLAEYQRRFGYIPFVEATDTTIYDAITVLVDESARAKWGQLGKPHVHAYHSQQAGVDILEPLYRQSAQ